MTYADYAEGWIDTRECSDLIDEMYWEANFSSERMLKRMELRAKEEGVELTDLDGFDYEDFFYGTYECTEKGLS